MQNFLRLTQKSLNEKKTPERPEEASKTTKIKKSTKINQRGKKSLLI